MAGNIDVSIVCNVYNHGQYIRDALEGFVTQKVNFSYEILVHDDASVDNSAEIIREYELRYPELIKPIYQVENQYSKRVKINRVFQAPRVKGKYVAFCEGDDYWTDPLKLQKQFDFMEAHPEYSMCAGSSIWLDVKTGMKENKCRIAEDRDIGLEEIILEEKGRLFQYASIFMKSELWYTLPEWMSAFPVGDYPLEIYAALNGKVRMISDVVAVYRCHAEGSWTSRIADNPAYKTKMFSGMIEGMNKLNEATGYQYKRVIDRRIKWLRYKIERASGNLKGMVFGESREIFKTRRIAAKVSDILMCVLPRQHEWMYRTVKKIKSKNN